MNTNERQHEMTRQLGEETWDPNERRKLETIAASFRSQIGDLRGQIAEYDALRSRRTKALPVASIEALPRALIRTRIAAGVSQHEVAERLGLDEERLIREEGNGDEALCVRPRKNIRLRGGVYR